MAGSTGPVAEIAIAVECRRVLEGPMASTKVTPKTPKVSKRTIAARKKRVADLERDPAMIAAIREALESERRGEGVRFEDLKRSND